MRMYTSVPGPVMPPSFWVASTKPEAALARGQGWQPWQERGWALAPRDRGPEAGMYCWMGHLAPGDPHRARLGQGLDDELVDVDVAGTRDREENAFGHVFGTEWVDAFVRRLRLLLVAAEANALACQRNRRGGADPARGTRNDRGLSLERGHNPAEVNLPRPVELRSAEGMA